MARMFSDRDVGEMRRLNRQNMPEQCVIQRSTRTRAAGGAIATAWLDVATVPCRLSRGSVSQSEALTAQQLQAIDRWTVVVDPSVSVTEGMRLNISGTLDDATPWTKALRVIATNGPTSAESMRKITAQDLLPGEA